MQLAAESGTCTPCGHCLVRGENYGFPCWDKVFLLSKQRPTIFSYSVFITDISLYFKSILKLVSLLFKYLYRKVIPLNPKPSSLLVRTKLGLCMWTYKTCLVNLRRAGGTIWTCAIAIQTAERKGRFLRKWLITFAAPDVCLTPYQRRKPPVWLSKQEKTDVGNSNPCYIV